MIEKLIKFSWGYAVFKAYVNFIHKYVHYRKIEIIGEENLPKDGPMIFVSNHQNALMDPLAVVLTAPGQPVSLARADIFKKPLFRKLLNTLKILPIYRQRDKVNTKEKNEEIFELLSQVLSAGKSMVIMPEGNNAAVRKLRPLKKGFARIAFKAESENNFDLNIKVIPMGLEYSSYTKTRSKLYIKYGKPLSVSEYENIWEESPDKATTKLTSDLSDRLKSVIINLPNQEVHRVSSLEVDLKYAPNKLNLAQREAAFEEAVERYSSVLEKNEDDQLQQKVKEIENSFKKLGEIPQHWNMFNTKIGFGDILLTVLSLPIAVWGYLHHSPLVLVHNWLNTKVKDKEFTSTFKLAAAVFVLPIVYLIFLGVSFIIPDSTLQLAYLISIPLSGIITFSLEEKYLHLLLRIKSIWMSKNPNWKKIKELEDHLFN
ncbi:lysophospholipid acyltransferase family protein [Sediminitomix flava]|uniref:1-acyl-sn-glycerol-3-phosphate acyltransferase n=1 Tax=Sediminitomix flava TaxID=379075 RepID=A0A315ZCJ0_SEDFL|nr:lysophospholipid acyltransferase family protein [Sediminitomix flava]PWJ42538.1 1-acyl-sn-glycerol-3-phosphate acyltransferase [Sediminitomix flava]